MIARCLSVRSGSPIFREKILPHIVQRSSEGHSSTNLVETESRTIEGFVVPEIRDGYHDIIGELKKNGFQTSVKIWEDGHIVPPFYNIYVEWKK